jgi:hypothetical protein
MKSKGGEEHIEVAEVVTSDAFSGPWAVVVVVDHADVTVFTVESVLIFDHMAYATNSFIASQLRKIKLFIILSQFNPLIYRRSYRIHKQQ